jgi:methionyl aminopeptidase
VSLSPRSKGELLLMRKSGEITAKALKAVLKAVQPGISLIELDKIAEAEIRSLGAQPSFMTVPGYSWTTCLTINNEVVHGIPRAIILKKGDLFSCDIGAVLNGWHTDAAWSVIVGADETDPSTSAQDDFSEKNRFLKAGEEAMWQGIKQATSGSRIGDIGAAMQKVVEGAGYSVVRSLVGHGIGKKLHEDPEVPGFGKPGKGLPLKKDMTIAIEAIYNQGGPDVVLDNDGWTISTKDGTWGGLFEMTVIVGGEEAEVLTDWRKY